MNHRQFVSINCSIPQHIFPWSGHPDLEGSEGKEKSGNSRDLDLARPQSRALDVIACLYEKPRHVLRAL